MNLLDHKPRRFIPVLVLTLIALTAGIALGSSGVRDVVSSEQASGAVVVPRATATRFAEAQDRVKHGKRGPRGRRGPKGKQGPGGNIGPQGPGGSQGAPGVSGDQVYNFSLNWQGQSSDPGPGATTTSLNLPGVGRLDVSCPWAFEAENESGSMTFTPAADNSTTRGVAAYTTIQGAGTSGVSSFYRLIGTSPNPVLPIGYSDTPSTYSSFHLPSNGMITGTLNIEPFSGNGAAGPPPASFTLSSEYIANDPVGANRFCHISGQVISRVG
jgi:hypothetical protein